MKRLSAASPSLNKGHELNQTALCERKKLKFFGAKGRTVWFVRGVFYTEPSRKSTDLTLFPRAGGDPALILRIA